MAVQEVRSHESKIYYEFSKFYERIFTGLLGPRNRSTINALSIPPGAASWKSAWARACRCRPTRRTPR